MEKSSFFCKKNSNFVLNIFQTVQVPSEDDPLEKIHQAVQYSLIFTDATGKLIFEERKFSEEGKL